MLIGCLHVFVSGGYMSVCFCNVKREEERLNYCHPPGVHGRGRVLDWRHIYNDRVLEGDHFQGWGAPTRVREFLKVRTKGYRERIKTQLSKVWEWGVITCHAVVLDHKLDGQWYPLLHSVTNPNLLSSPMHKSMFGWPETPWPSVPRAANPNASRVDHWHDQQRQISKILPTTQDS